MTPDDARVRALFAAAREADVTPLELRRALHAAERPRPWRSGTRITRPLTLAAVGVAAVVGAGFVGLPLLDRQPGSTASLGGPLDAVAATAAAQPAPQQGGKYRYQRVRDQLTYATSTAAVTVELRSQTWADAGGNGLRRVGDPRFVDRIGAPAVVEQIVREQEQIAWAGDWEPEPVIELETAGDELDRVSTDPQGLIELMMRWHPDAKRPGVPRERIAYDQICKLIELLTRANASPALRSAAYRAIALLGDVRPIGERRDELGRVGTAIELRFGPNARPAQRDESGSRWLGGANAARPFTLELIFDPATSMILSWREQRELRFAPVSPATEGEHSQVLSQSHLYEASGFVKAVGERPAVAAVPLD